MLYRTTPDQLITLERHITRIQPPTVDHDMIFLSISQTCRLTGCECLYLYFLFRISPGHQNEY